MIINFKRKGLSLFISLNVGIVMPIEEEEYELVPLSPLRRMEKRLERLEKAGTSQDMVKELIDVVRTNQQIVDDMVKINSDIINKISELSGSINNMLTKVDEFLSRIELEETTAQEAKKEEAQPAETTNDADRRLDRLEKRINSLILSTMARTRPMQRPVQKRPA